MYRIILCLFLIMYCQFGATQKRPYEEVESELEKASGKERIKLLIELCRQDIYNDQLLARQRASEAFILAKQLNENYGKGWGLRYIGLSHHFEGSLDSARVYYVKCAPYFEAPKDKGWSFFNIASLFENQSEFDSALYYLNIAEPLFIKDNAKTELGAVSNMRGTISAFKGDWNQALPYFLKARDLFEEAGDQSRKADAIVDLGNANASLENYEICIEYLKEASAIYEQENDGYYQSKALNFIGYYLYEINEKDSAVYYLEKALTLSKKVNHNFIIGNTLRDLAVIEIDEGQYDNARSKLLESDQYFKILDDKAALAYNYQIKGDLEFKANRLVASEKAYKTGLNLSREVDARSTLVDIHKGLKSLYKQRGEYQNSLNHFDQYVTIKDSISSDAQMKNMQHLLIKYETEKKEKELVIATAENERRAANAKLFMIGLISLLISAISIIYSIIQRKKKEQAILIQQHLEEKQKRKLAEKELEFKQKELVARALQLAKKNEFLHQLETEVLSLKSTVNHSLNQTSDKIARMIQYDASDDDEWNQFSKEFSSIHSGFRERLLAAFGKFSTSEMRLITLLKMNLSSKDIANILRVSDAGIKKARYRLRKKMNVNSEVNLQSFILAF